MAAMRPAQVYMLAANAAVCTTVRDI